MANEGALALMDDDKAIAQIASGRLMRDIAAEYGVSKPAIYKRLKTHPEYRDAIHAQADSLVEEALDQVMKCDVDTVNIARARFDACHKWAVSRNPEVWGSKAGGNVVIDLGSALQALSERMQGRNATEQPPITHDAEQQKP